MPKESGKSCSHNGSRKKTKGRISYGGCCEQNNETQSSWKPNLKNTRDISKTQSLDTMIYLICINSSLSISEPFHVWLIPLKQYRFLLFCSVSITLRRFKLKKSKFWLRIEIWIFTYELCYILYFWCVNCECNRITRELG